MAERTLDQVVVDRGAIPFLAEALPLGVEDLARACVASKQPAPCHAVGCGSRYNDLEHNRRQVLLAAIVFCRLDQVLRKIAELLARLFGVEGRVTIKRCSTLVDVAANDREG